MLVALSKMVDPAPCVQDGVALIPCFCLVEAELLTHPQMAAIYAGIETLQRPGGDVIGLRDFSTRILRPDVVGQSAAVGARAMLAVLTAGAITAPHSTQEQATAQDRQ